MVFLSAEEAMVLGLSPAERDIFIAITADNAAHLMAQVALSGTFTRGSSNECVVHVSLSEEMSIKLEDTFYARVAADLGNEVLQRFLSAREVRERVEASLLRFGRQPFALSFRGLDGELQNATKYEWTHAFMNSGQPANVSLLAGAMSREGLMDVYGPVADRVLTGR